MIILYIGNVGAGKTLQAVRQMALTPWITYYSNIHTFGLPNVHTLKYDMIISKVDTGTASKGKPVYEYRLNVDFWMNVKKPVSVVLDEVHNILSSRMSMSKTSRIAAKWLSLLRKIVGQGDAGYGNLICLTQLSGAADTILRQMAHRVVYFRNEYTKECRQCGWKRRENTDSPRQKDICMRCKGHELFKKDYVIHRFSFASVPLFDLWKATGESSAYFEYKKIKGSEKFFKNYDTLQMDDLFSDY